MGSGKGTSKSTTAPPKEIMEAYKKSIGYAGQAISKPYEQYQGQLVAGLNPTQQQGIANVNAAQGAALPYIQQGAGFVNQAAQGVNPQMINQFMSPYLNTVVGATQRNLLESNAQQQNALKSQAIQSGAFGGDRARIGQAELSRQQGLAGGQVIGGLMNQGFGQAMAGAQQNVQNMMQGGQMLGGMGQAAQQSILQGAQAQLAAGAQQQATDQAFLQSAYDQFLQRQAFPFQQAQFYANIAQGIGAGAGGTTSQTPAAPNAMSQIFGGLTALGSFGLSDERAKENIEPVGKTNDGQTIYRYNYKGSPKTEIGLIAQEVEKKHPEAVASLGDIKMVDYEAATENSAQRSGKALGGSSMGGLVTPNMQRQAFAQGGFGSLPYADFRTGMSFIPEGKMSGQSPGSTLPAGYKMEDLQKMVEGSSFDQLNAMSEEDIANMQKGLGNIGKKMGLSPVNDGAGGLRPPSYKGPLSSFGPSVNNFFSNVRGFMPFADGGGVVPRHGYQTDGAVRDESPLPPFLVAAESGGDFSADNDLGYVGRGQFGEARLTDAKRAGVLPPDVTIDQFKADPGLQQAVESWHVQDVNNFIEDRGLGAFVGKEINGVPVTPQGLLAVAHLGGKGGMEKFVKSGGRYNPADANGTSLMDYLALAAGTEGGVIPVNQDPAATEASPAGVVPVDLPEMPPAGVAPPPMGDVQAMYSPASGVVPASDEEPATGEEPARRRSIIESILGQDMSDQARTGMLAAGLAMMGGTSPYFGVNVGKGGLAGLQTYYKGLENQRENAVKATEIAQKRVETAKTDQERMLALNAAWMNYNMVLALNGKPDITFEEYMKIFEAQKSGAPALGASPAMPQGSGIPTIGEDSDTGSEETPSTPGDDTVEAEETSFIPGGDPEKSGTLNFYQNKLSNAQRALAYTGNDPTKLAAIQSQIDSAKASIDKITSSPFYIAQQSATGQDYDDLRMNLLRMGELNANYQGGRGSEQIAQLVGLARTFGADALIPDDLLTNPDAYDELLKITTTMAIEQAQQSGLLKAPGQALEAESKIVPGPELSPGARYELIVKSLAIADRNRDLYSGWDTSPDTNTYIRKWQEQKAKEAKDAGFDNYMDMYLDKAKKEVPTPRTGLPTELDARLSTALERKYPDAEDGTRVKSPNGKMAVKKNGKWVWEQ